MATKIDELKILRFLRTKRNGIGVNELSRNLNLSKPILNKILKKLETHQKITKSSFKRGKSSIVILTKFHHQDNFKKIKKREVMRDETQESVIIKTKNNVIYAGNIDEYESQTIFLYDVHKLKSTKWIPLKIQDVMLELQEIDVMFETNLLNLDLEEISLRDMMKLWLNPNHMIKKGINCEWDLDGTPHSKGCNKIIHESLVNLYTSALDNKKSDHKKLEKSLENLIYYFLERGEKIPHSNF